MVFKSRLQTVWLYSDWISCWNMLACCNTLIKSSNILKGPMSENSKWKPQHIFHWKSPKWVLLGLNNMAGPTENTSFLFDRYFSLVSIDTHSCSLVNCIKMEALLSFVVMVSRVIGAPLIMAFFLYSRMSLSQGQHT